MYRHSSAARYWIYNVATKTLDYVVPATAPAAIDASPKVRLASWAPALPADTLSLAYIVDNVVYVRSVGAAGGDSAQPVSDLAGT